MSYTNRVVETQSAYGILFNNVKILGLKSPKARVHPSTMLEVWTQDGNLKSCLKIFGGDSNSGNNAVGLYQDEDDRTEIIFESVLGDSSTDQTGGAIDLGFLHDVIRHRSEEEQRRECYIFENNHATELREVYTKWAAQVFARNCDFSAKITIDLAAQYAAGTLRLVHRKSGWEYEIFFRSELNDNDEEWEALQKSILGLQPTTV